MKMFKTIPMFILLFTGCLGNAQEIGTTESSPHPTEGVKHVPRSPGSPANGTQGSEPVRAGKNLPGTVVAAVSIALVLLCILIVAVFWYAWKKSQEGSMELNPVPYGGADVSVRNPSVPENQQE